MNNIYILSSNKSRLNNIYRIYISNNSFCDFFNEHSINDPTTKMHFNTTCNNGLEILDCIRKIYITNLILSNDEFDQYSFDNICNVINIVLQTINQQHIFTTSIDIIDAEIIKINAEEKVIRCE